MAMFGNPSAIYPTGASQTPVAWDEQFDEESYRRYMDYLRRHPEVFDNLRLGGPIQQSLAGGKPGSIRFQSPFAIPGASNKPAYYKAYESVRREMGGPAEPITRVPMWTGPKSSGTEFERSAKRIDVRAKRVQELNSVLVNEDGTPNTRSTPGQKAQAQEALRRYTGFTPAAERKAGAQVEKAEAGAAKATIDANWREREKQAAADKAAENLKLTGKRIDQITLATETERELQKKRKESAETLRSILADKKVPTSIKAKLRQMVGQIIAGNYDPQAALDEAAALVSAEEAKRLQAETKQIDTETRADKIRKEAELRAAERKEIDDADKSVKANDKVLRENLYPQLQIVESWVEEAKKRGGRVSVPIGGGQEVYKTEKQLADELRRIKEWILKLEDENRGKRPLALRKGSPDYFKLPASAPVAPAAASAPVQQEAQQPWGSGHQKVNPETGQTVEFWNGDWYDVKTGEQTQPAQASAEQQYENGYRMKRADGRVIEYWDGDFYYVETNELVTD